MQQLVGMGNLNEWRLSRSERQRDKGGGSLRIGRVIMALQRLGGHDTAVPIISKGSSKRGNGVSLSI
mgnify:CR=1